MGTQKARYTHALNLEVVRSLTDAKDHSLTLRCNYITE